MDRLSVHLRLLALPVGLVALLACAATAHAAAWTATALDANRDGRIDAIAMSGVPRALRSCPRWTISGARVARAARGRSGRVVLSVVEPRSRLAARPSVTCASRRGRTVVRISKAIRERRAALLAATAAEGAASTGTARPPGVATLARPQTVASSQPYPDLPAIDARSAGAFLDSVGVNVHLGYYDTAYANFDAVRGKLADLGVRHVRDGACADCVDQQNRLLALAAAGIHADLIMGRPDGPASVAQLVSLVAGRLRPAVDAVEGPNELDQSGLAGWAGKLSTWQQQLYSLVKANPATSDLPVIGPSLVAGASYGALGDLSGSMDCGNLHPYSGGRVPMARLASDLSLARLVSGDKPVCVTEAGYHDALATTDGHLPTSQEADAAYVPRLYLDFFAAGIPRTYLYELVDEWPDAANASIESHFGLLGNDFSEKPAYRTLQRLLALTAPGDQAQALGLHASVSGPGDLRTLLLQRDAHHQALVLWRDAPVWDPVRRADLPVPAQDAQVSFGQPVDRADVQALDAEAPASYASPRSLDVPVGGMPVVVSLTLQ